MTMATAPTLVVSALVFLALGADRAVGAAKAVLIPVVIGNGTEAPKDLLAALRNGLADGRQLEV